MLCLIITCGCVCILCGETLTLIDRIVQLGVCITHLPCIDEELETLYLAWIRRLLLRQWRNLDWMIHDKCWLDQLLLAELLEEQVDNITLLMTILVCDMMLVSQLLRLCIICYLIKINTCIFLDRVIHRQALKRLTKVDLNTIVRDLCAATYLLSQVTEHRLCQFHHALVISIRLIQLHQCEFRIVAGIHTLVTEYTTDLKYSFQSANNQSLQI